jgi:selenocysteine-specific elongation factor
MGTAAGGRVLDPFPPRGPARRRATAERLVALRRASDPTAWAAASLELHGIVVDGGYARLAGDTKVTLEAEALEAVARHHAAEPDSAGMPLPELRLRVSRVARRIAALDEAGATAVASAVTDGLIADGRLARAGDRIREPGRGPAIPAPLAAAMDRLEAALDLPAPPTLSEAARLAACPPEGVSALATAGRIIRLEPELAWSASAYQRLAARALAMAAHGPLSPAAFRDATGTSRRYVLAILEDLDRREILRRTPDGHVPGPRAPR